MTQVQNIQVNSSEAVNQQVEEDNSYLYDEIVEELVCQGLPRAFSPNNFLARIAATYSITVQDARTCLKMAIKELELIEAKKNKADKPQANTNDVPFQQTGYYYPNSSITVSAAKNDGMDNLNSYGSYNRLMFGLK